MLVPFNWLKEIIDLPSVEKTAQLLTAAGLEVEEIVDYKGKDKVLKTEITPNRGDLASIIGVAREMAALTGKSVKQDLISELSTAKSQDSELDIEIIAKTDCLIYAAVVVNGVEIKESDSDIISKLDQVGIRAINNIVDATNYIMMLYGQPIHAFDADKIKGSKIIIRKAEKGESIKLIDGKILDLANEDLVIADEAQPIALAGIMGGLDTEVTKDTKNIVFESAWFKPEVIRATAKRFNLQTEASYRFERTVDSAQTKKAASLTAKLITDREVAKPVIVNNWPKQAKEIRVDTQKINQILGLDLKQAEIIKYLERVGCEIKDQAAIAPTWRSDLNISPDLAEEVGRIYGYEKLPEQDIGKVQNNNTQSRWWKTELLKDVLSSLNITEVENYPYLSKAKAKVLNLKTDQLIEIQKPVNQDINYLRNSLMPGLIRDTAKNPQESEIMIYEIGEVFNKKKEWSKLGIALSGKKALPAKKLIQSLEAELSLKGLDWQIKSFKKEDLKKYKVKREIVELIEIDLDSILDQAKFKGNSLVKMPKHGFEYQPLSKYPVVNRDLAFIMDKETLAAEVEKEIKSISDLLIRIELFDEFASDKFGKDKKNLAWHLFFQSANKTLTDIEVDKVIKQIVTKVSKKFQAKLRS